MVSYSKIRVDSLAFSIYAKAKIKLLIAGFGLLRYNKIFNFTKMHYLKILLVWSCDVITKKETFKMMAETIILADNT